MDYEQLLYYYLTKRFFLFLDEWGFYLILYKLYKDKYYKIFLTVLLYGSGCIYTSYTNISKIEKYIFKDDQEFYALNPTQLGKLVSLLANKFIKN